LSILTVTLFTAPCVDAHTAVPVSATFGRGEH
jgi:hypothetical protein